MVCAEAEKDGSRRGGAEGVIPSVYSLEHILKGSAPAAVICFLSLYSIVSHPIHPIWFVYRWRFGSLSRLINCIGYRRWVRGAASLSPGIEIPSIFGWAASFLASLRRECGCWSYLRWRHSSPKGPKFPKGLRALVGTRWLASGPSMAKNLRDFLRIESG
jgi:hypothetical protein